MTLAAILVLDLLSLGAPNGVLQDQAAPAPQTQASPVSNPNPATPTPGQQSSTQPSPKRHRAKAKAKKVSTSDCSPSSPTSKSNHATAGTPAANSASGQSNPCPPAKKIVKDGGTDEPTVQLKVDTTPEKASNEISSTEQLRLATEDNLKKISGRQLTASQQEVVNQIKQFMDQSKSAVADGDLERGRNLAMKARLLSDALASQ
jgi:hypothetical protein